MAKRKITYLDEALAGDLRAYLASVYLNVSQSERRVYVKYGLEKKEYTGIFYSKKGKRFFAFHLENPINNVLNTLETRLMNNEAVKKRGKIKEYEEIFRKIEIGKSSVSYEEEGVVKEIPSFSIITKIKKIPSGTKGHLSGNFSKFLFEYIIQPFILTVEGHKIKQ